MSRSNITRSSAAGETTKTTQAEVNGDGDDVQFRYMEHQGPLPPPQILAGYESAIEGAGKQLMEMAKARADHTMKIESETHQTNIELAKGNLQQQGRGQLMGFTLALAGLAGGVWLGVAGALWPACGALLAATVGISTAFAGNRAVRSMPPKSLPPGGSS